MGDNIERLVSAGYSRRKSCPGLLKHPIIKERKPCRVLLMGSEKVGKSSLIAQLQDEKSPQRYQPILKSMHQVVLTSINGGIILNIEEISGSYAFNFPAVFELSVALADAVVLVYAVDEWKSFNELAALREKVLMLRSNIPIIVVGNKADLEGSKKEKITAKLMVGGDWEMAYCECSAKQDTNIGQLFQRIIQTTEAMQSIGVRGTEYKKVELADKRRNTLPLVQKRLDKHMMRKMTKVGRRTSCISPPLRRDSCIIYIN